MIPEGMIKSLARRQGIDPAVVSRDHTLGIVLWAMNSQGSLQDWVFKGGTCWSRKRSG
jgi:predicted nucleotidyltransferase component of viral defense system